MEDLTKEIQNALGSNLRDGREKMSVDDLIRKYPDGVTIVGFELAKGQDGSYGVYAIGEEKKYFSGGGDLKKLEEFLTTKFEGDISGINEYLRGKPLKLRIWKVKTKTRKDYTKAALVEEPRDES